MQPANFDAEAAFLKEQYKVLSTAVYQPYTIRTKVLDPLLAKYTKQLYLGILVFGVSDAAPEVIPMTQLEGAKALVALRRWYSIHTNAPPDFATLCRAAGLTDVSRDYFSDGPLRMITFRGTRFQRVSGPQWCAWGGWCV